MIKTIGSSSCKQIISVVILKANIPIHNVQTCNDGFFLSHKIIQLNGAIAFSKHYSNVFIRIFLWMKVFICRKLTIASKRKLNTRSIKDKYSALKEVEDEKTKSQVAAKYGIPKNTLSTWLKNKDKVFEAKKKGSNSKRQRLRQGTFSNLDQAMFKWLLVV